MKFTTQIKPISYLKTHTAEVARNFETDSSPLVITQNGEAKFIIQDIGEYEQKEETLALLMLLAQGQKDKKAGSGMSAAELEGACSIRS